MATTVIDTGGPAFPGTEYYDERPYAAHDGMTLRDYFAAHAPVEPAGWFQPWMVTKRPTPEMFGGECVNAAVIHAWEVERVHQRCIQWPYAWADAQLAERTRVRVP